MALHTIVLKVLLVILLGWIGFDLLTAAPMVSMWEDLFLRIAGALMLAACAVVMID